MIRNGDSVFFDWDNDRVLRGGVEATITGQQKKLLRLLIEEKPAIKPKDYLLNGVWGKRAELVDELYLVQLVYRLRKALSAVGLDGHIVTVPREGYRFIPVPYAVVRPDPSGYVNPDLEHARGLAHVLARLGLPAPTQAPPAANDDLHVDESQGVISYGGVVAKVTRFELRLLAALVEHRDTVMSRQEIIGAVWGANAMVDENCLTQLVSRLRRALHPLGLDNCVAAVPKVGYRFRQQGAATARAPGM
ncbi:winged helix-turn-helix domain-containing protein [Cupriavidus campinensis]